MMGGEHKIIVLRPLQFEELAIQFTRQHCELRWILWSAFQWIKMVAAPQEWAPVSCVDSVHPTYTHDSWKVQKFPRRAVCSRCCWPKSAWPEHSRAWPEVHPLLSMVQFLSPIPVQNPLNEKEHAETWPCCQAMSFLQASEKLGIAWHRKNKREYSRATKIQKWPVSIWRTTKNNRNRGSENSWGWQLFLNVGN